MLAERPSDVEQPQAHGNPQQGDCLTLLAIGLSVLAGIALERCKRCPEIDSFTYRS